MTSDALLGPLAALALSLLINGLFYAGKILARNAVPREEMEEWKAMALRGAGIIEHAVDRTAAIVDATQPTNAAEVAIRLDRIEKALAAIARDADHE